MSLTNVEDVKSFAPDSERQTDLCIPYLYMKRKKKKKTSNIADTTPGSTSTTSRPLQSGRRPADALMQGAGAETGKRVASIASNVDRLARLEGQVRAARRRLRQAEVADAAARHGGTVRGTPRGGREAAASRVAAGGSQLAAARRQGKL